MYLGFLCACRCWLSRGPVGSVALLLHNQLIINANVSIQLPFTTYKRYGQEFGCASYRQRKMYRNIYEVMWFARDKNTLWKHDINLSTDTWVQPRIQINNEENMFENAVDHVCSIGIAEKIDRLILMRNGFGYFNHARHAIHFNYCRWWWPHEHVETIRRSMFYGSVAVPVVDAGATWNGNFRHIFITEKIENFIYLVDAFGCLNNHYVHHKAFLVVRMASLPHATFPSGERGKALMRVFAILMVSHCAQLMHSCVFISDATCRRAANGEPPKNMKYIPNANWRACVKR